MRPTPASLRPPGDAVNRFRVSSPIIGTNLQFCSVLCGSPFIERCECKKFRQKELDLAVFFFWYGFYNCAVCSMTLPVVQGILWTCLSIVSFCDSLLSLGQLIQCQQLNWLRAGRQRLYGPLVVFYGRVCYPYLDCSDVIVTFTHRHRDGERVGCRGSLRLPRTVPLLLLCIYAGSAAPIVLLISSLR